MKFAIMESIITEGGHEIEYDRILVEELIRMKHEVEFYVPAGHVFKWSYGVPVHFLTGSGVAYRGARGLRKALLAAKREINRQRWYRQIFELACQNRFDALIFPTATYRYLRALRLSSLKKCPIPLIFVIHGLRPWEASLLFAEAERLKENTNIKIVVLSFVKANSLETGAPPNIHYIYPSNYIPRDIPPVEPVKQPMTLTLGFFGQYRREKNLDGFLEQLMKCDFKRNCKFIIQGATTTPLDAADFERIIKKYEHTEILEFWHRPLIGEEWQQAISMVDAIVMPYGAERYRYNPSAILSTAIGFAKPVVVADNINPEVMNTYGIGKAFAVGDQEDLRKTIEEFVNTFDDRFAEYHAGLAAAGQEYAPSRLVEGLVRLADNKRCVE